MVLLRPPLITGKRPRAGWTPKASRSPRRAGRRWRGARRWPTRICAARGRPCRRELASPVAGDQVLLARRTPAEQSRACDETAAPLRAQNSGQNRFMSATAGACGGEPRAKVFEGPRARVDRGACRCREGLGDHRAVNHWRRSIEPPRRPGRTAAKLRSPSAPPRRRAYQVLHASTPTSAGRAARLVASGDDRTSTTATSRNPVPPVADSAMPLRLSGVGNFPPSNAMR